MNQIPNTCIILGGGKSMLEGISKGLWDKIRNKFTIGCNSVVFDFIPTIATFVDDVKFYKLFKEKVDKLPFAIAREKPIIKEALNRIVLKDFTTEYGQSNGIKKLYIGEGGLTGVFSMSIAIELGVTVIYLLGFDWTKRKNKKDDNEKVITHYYQEEPIITDSNKIRDLFEQGKIQHRGVGKVDFYETHEPMKTFKPFIDKGLQIYNVSMESNINCFPKIIYDEFFKKIASLPDYNQNELRKLIKEKIKKLCEQ